MTAWLPVTGGESGASVFRSADGSRYAKVVGAAGVGDLAAERDRVAWAGEQGLPVPAVIDWHTTADGGARLITSAAGDRGGDRRAAAARRAVRSVASWTSCCPGPARSSLRTR
ncbi:streptomycin phosphotransferase [Mycolicibacterium conceptionense]|uniref:Streptomycin phosphotransferase n=1 Tax=Mycolicibacterium conceptionense TaxID=451644 RepID=A0A0U1D7U3_9MYCO|nr:streptomycin phosphotransferase [Mycolicibacterium conceptionense]